MNAELENLPIPPYEMCQDRDFYTICFNMYGIPKAGIRVAMDTEARRFTVFAERAKREFTDQFLWIFSLPASVDVKSVETYYDKGVVQFNFPKKRLVS